jgi:putative FmdB family regulatory protein
MPIYEYRCAACGADFERYVAAPGVAVACPACASPDVRRKLSVFGLRRDDPVATMPSGGGGCCGGGCGCH